MSVLVPLFNFVLLGYGIFMFIILRKRLQKSIKSNYRKQNGVNEL